MVKRKIEAEAEQTKVSGPGIPKAAHTSDSVDAIVTEWSDAVKSLRGRRFPNIESAQNAIIDVVADKLKLGTESTTSLRQFLHLVLETDPEFQEQLRRDLTIDL